MLGQQLETRKVVIDSRFFPLKSVVNFLFPQLDNSGEKKCLEPGLHDLCNEGQFLLFLHRCNAAGQALSADVNMNHV